MTVRRARARATPVLMAAMIAMGVAGCANVEDAVGGAVDSAVGQAADETTRKAAAQAVATAVSTVLDRAGVTLQDAPDCSPDMQVDGLSANGSVDCTATTTGGKPVAARFAGEVSVRSCSGSLRIVVGTKEVADLTDIPTCLLASL